MNSKDLIQTLQLQPHPEGGYFKETYRAEKTVALEAEKVRSVSTAIYYLLEDQDFSAFHRIQSDELWFFHQGEPLEIVSIQEGKLVSEILGNNVTKGEKPQVIIPAKVWFAARIQSSSGYALVSCTVAPGFDFADFELAERNALTTQFPHLKETIAAFTRA